MYGSSLPAGSKAAIVFFPVGKRIFFFLTFLKKKNALLLVTRQVET
jgi:hypothetical protein